MYYDESIFPGAKHAVYTGSRNLYPSIVTSAKSLVANTGVDFIWILAEDDDLGEELPWFFRVINASRQTFFRKDGPNMASQFTYFAMLRAALCYILPLDVTKVLSLDADVIAVTKEADYVWDLDLDRGGGYYFSAAKELHRSHNGLLYCNTGVALYNLEKLLLDGKAKEVMDVLNTRKYTWVEQDVMNYLCQGRIMPMPPEYNVNDWTGPNSPVRIRHYAGMKKWDDQPDYLEYSKMSWDEVFMKRERNRYGK